MPEACFKKKKSYRGFIKLEVGSRDRFIQDAIDGVSEVFLTWLAMITEPSFVLLCDFTEIHHLEAQLPSLKQFLAEIVTNMYPSHYLSVANRRMGTLQG